LNVCDGSIRRNNAVPDTVRNLSFRQGSKSIFIQLDVLVVRIVLGQPEQRCANP
jgi:hypothetical protein